MSEKKNPGRIVYGFVVVSTFVLLIYNIRINLQLKSLEVAHNGLISGLIVSCAVYLGLLVAGGVFAFSVRRFREKTFVVINSISLLFFSGLLTAVFAGLDNIFGVDLPSGVLNLGDFILMNAMFCSIPVLLTLLMAVSYIVNKVAGKIYISAGFGVVIAVPLFLYFIVVVCSELALDDISYFTLLVVSCVIGGLLFLLALTTLLYSLFRFVKKRTPAKIMTIIESLVMLFIPVGSLSVYHVLSSGSGVFIMGNYFTPVFLTLMGLSAVLFALPDLMGGFTIVVYFLRICILPFVLYLLAVYIPFVPFGVAGLIVFGAGIFILIPVIFGVLALIKVKRQYNFLHNSISHRRVKAFIPLLGGLVIPVAFVVNAKLDRKVFDEAADFISRTDYSVVDTKIDLNRLEKVLERVDFNNDLTEDIFWVDDGSYPLLSSVYNFILCRNQVPGSQVYSDLWTLASGGSSDYVAITKGVEFKSGHNGFNRSESAGKVQNVDIDTVFDKEKNCWRSDVVLKISGPDWGSEFFTKIKISGDAYVSDYYLMIDGRKESGILAERRSAEWVYGSIVRRRRDPGFLRYDKYGNIELNVFPVRNDEVRETGFSFCHEGAFSFNMNGKKFSVDIPVHVSEKKINKSVVLKPEIYLFIESSAAAEAAESEGSVEKAEALFRRNCLENLNIAGDIEIAEVLGFDYSVRTLESLSSGKYKINSNKCTDAFRACAYAYTSHDYSGKTFPLPVFIVSKKINLNRSLVRLRMEFPVADTAFVLFLESGKTAVVDFSNDDLSVMKTKTLPDQLTVDVDFLERCIRLQSDTGLAAHKDSFKDKKLEGFCNQAKHLRYLDSLAAISPEFYNRNCLSLIKSSFELQCLTDQTAFLALESEQQKKILKQYQAKVLGKMKDVESSGRKEVIEEAAEPPLVIVCALLAGLLLLIEFRRRRLRRMPR